MRQIVNLTQEAHQQHTIILADGEITLTLRFYPTIEQWNFDVSFPGSQIFGAKFSLGVLHLESANLPFDFIVIDSSGQGIDPFKIDDFMDGGRCKLYILDPVDMEVIRGVPVEI